MSCSYIVPNQHYLRLGCLTKVGTIGRIAADRAELLLIHGSAGQNFRQKAGSYPLDLASLIRVAGPFICHVQIFP
jgi:hypothetical protein